MTQHYQGKRQGQARCIDHRQITDADGQILLGAWMILDGHTFKHMLVGSVRRRYATLSKANAYCERKNQAYGAVRYVPVLDTESPKHWLIPAESGTRTAMYVGPNKDEASDFLYCPQCKRIIAPKLDGTGTVVCRCPINAEVS